jgi:hypothetical protein
MRSAAPPQPQHANLYKEIPVLLDTQKQEKPKTVHKTVGENVGFERTRRITGYLVGTLNRFNNAKRAEERDRVKHTTE